MRKNHSKIVCIKLVHLPYFPVSFWTMTVRFFSYLQCIKICRDFLGHKKAFTINDYTYIFGDRLTAVSVCAHAVEKTDACLTSQCHVLGRKCSFVNDLVLYLEENTKRAAGLFVNGGEVSS